MAFQDHFSARASAYTRFRPDYPDELIAFVARIAPARRLVWDCATGNGQAAVPLAAYFDRVIATDASASQVEHARPHERVEYRVAAAEASGLPDHAVDAVTVAQALHWLDLDRFYREVARVLVPAGVLVVWSYGDPTLMDADLDRRLQWFNHEVMGPYWPTERGAVGRGYLAMPSPFPELPAPELTLERSWTLAELLGYLGTWSSVSAYRRTQQDDPLPLAEREIGAAWGEPDTRRVIRWPLTVRAGRAPA